MCIRDRGYKERGITKEISEICQKQYIRHFQSMLSHGLMELFTAALLSREEL